MSSDSSGSDDSASSSVARGPAEGVEIEMETDPDLESSPDIPEEATGTVHCLECSAVRGVEREAPDAVDMQTHSASSSTQT